MTIDETRLRHALGSADLAWLLQRARARFEVGKGIEGSVTLRTPTPGQRDALNRLLGRSGAHGASLAVPLPEVDRLLRDGGICSGLFEAIEVLSGPIVDRKKEAAEQEARWAAALAAAETRAGGERPRITAWARETCQSGLLRRLSAGDAERGAALLLMAVDVALRLPATDVPIAELAATVTGDSHGLDVGQPLGTLCLRYAATLGGGGDWDDAEGRRDTWASVGIVCDELSAPILVLNLRSDESTVLGRALAVHADAGEPYRISVRQLLRSRARFSASSAGNTVFVCENPTVVAAVADRLGARSAPLVCIDGQPKTAARLLLTRLRAAGFELAYHGDFDWPGVQIANLVMQRHGARPWRMSTDDYESLRAERRSGAMLEGEAVAASWDAALEPAMRAGGYAVHEEQTLAELVGDLA